MYYLQKKQKFEVNSTNFTLDVFRRATLLIFDNDQTVAEIKEVLKLLPKCDFTYLATTNLDEFKTLIKKNKPNLIISGLFINETANTELIEYCKMVYPEIPHIILSSHNCNKSALHFLDMGAADYLTKENISNLPSTIYKALRQSLEKDQIKEAKKQRWEDAQRFKALIEHSLDPVITYNNSGTIIYASPAIERVLGYKPSQFIGTNVVEHIHPEDLIIRENKFDNLIKSSNEYASIDEERLRHKEGHYIWVKAIISDGRLIPGIEGFMTNFRDITETVRNKKALENSLRDLTDYKIALDESSIVGITNLSGKIIYANDELVKISKFSQKELLVSDFKLFNSKTHSAIFYLKIWKTISSGKIWKGEIKMKAKNGSFFWTNMTIVPFLNENKKPYQYIVVMRDITPRILKTQELHDTISLLSSQNKRLLNFSYIVSHNLRSHTSNMQNLINYIEETEDETEKLEMINHLKTITNALDETMYNLNEVVSIQSGSELKIETIKLKPFITQFLKVLESHIEKTNASIEININDDICVSYSKSYLESIIHNLLLNSLKYKHPDRNPNIIISLRNDKKYTVLSIKDNGLGIDIKKHKDKLFGMYKTFHNNIDSRGLGLFMSKNQVEAMGGKIEVFSEVGRGTTFEIYIK